MNRIWFKDDKEDDYCLAILFFTHNISIDFPLYK